MPRPEWEELLLLRLEKRIDELYGKDRQAAAPQRRRRWLVVASAASILPLGLTLVFVLSVGVKPATADFAGMLKRLSQAATVLYDLRVCATGEPEETARVSMSLEGRTRVAWSDGRVHVISLVDQQGLALSPNRLRATKWRVAADASYDDPLQSLKRTEAAAGQSLGSEVLNHLKVDVYRVRLPDKSMKVWVDRKLELPVRIEVRAAMSGGREMLTVMENFAWDLPLAPEIFSLGVPPGYKLEQPQAEPSEEALLQMLRICAQRADGRFPEKPAAKTVALLLGGKADQSSDAAHVMVHMDDQTRELYRTCLRGLAFVEQMTEEGEWVYIGGGVRLGDAQSPVCWWKTPDATRYRLVYGDLRVEEVLPEHLPRVDVPP